MNSIPALEETDPIRESMSIEEIRIAINLLKKRFSDYHPNEIINTLSEYLAQKESLNLSQSALRPPNLNVLPPQQSVFLHHQPFMTVSKQREIKKQQIRLIAILFSQSGIKYSLAQIFIPQITQKQYKSCLQTIAVQTLNDIEKYLRYECSVTVEKLSTQQKRAIREKLINVRDWMGKTHPEPLQTYLIFVRRHYLDPNLEVDYKKAIELYRVILISAKGPEVQIREEPHTNRGLRQQFRIDQQNTTTKKLSFSKQEQNTLIVLFKQHPSIDKVSDLMCQKYGYDIKWSVHSIKNILKRIYKVSLRKLASTAQKCLNLGNSLWFGYGDEDVNTLIEYENSLPIKIQLLDFYMLSKITPLKLKQYVKKVNEFYIKQNNCNAEEYQKISDDDVQIPVLLVKQKSISYIQIKDENTRTLNSIPKKQGPKKKIVSNRFNNRHQKNQRRSWIEYVQIQDEKPQYQFSGKRGQKQKYHSEHEQTDVEDDQPRKKRQKQIFKPKSFNREQSKVEKKNQELQVDFKKIKSRKIYQELDESHNFYQSQNQEIKIEYQPILQENLIPQIKIVPKDATLQKKKLRKLDLDHSYDSIESEPIRSNAYGNSISKGRNFLNNLLSRKKISNKEKNHRQLNICN